MKPVWLGAMILAIIALPCLAQERAAARATMDLDIVSLGDRLTLTVEVDHAPGQTVVWPALSDTLGSFEVLGTTAVVATVADGRQRSTKQYVLTTFELGDLEVPALDLAVADSGDSEPQTLSTRPIPVTVQSVGIDASGDIRTVKAPLEMPRNWLLLLPWVVLIAGLGALAYWLYRRYRSRDEANDGTAESTEPARPPHEVAYEALELLEAKRLLDRGEVKQYFIEVSEIIRTYLEGRYPIDALEMTSFEVLSAMRHLGLASEVYDLFPPFFDRADLVKFAKHRPGLELCREMIPMARRLVDETRMKDHPPEPPETAGEGDALSAAAAVSKVEVS